MVFDVYTGPGATLLQIDDLAIDGLVEARFEGSLDESSSSETSLTAPVTSLDVNTQIVRLQRTVPRLLQYRGESLDWLKSMGFNGILTENEADTLLTEQATRNQMHLIAPPPSQTNFSLTQENLRSINVWHLSSAASLADLDRTRDAALDAGKFSRVLSRPRFVEAMESMRFLVD